MIKSTLWFERLQREIFITALLMAEPFYTDEEMPQLNVRNLNETGWKVPPSGNTPYGFVPAAGVGIVRLAVCSNEHVDIEPGLEALEKLGEPEQSSRTPDYEGRRLVRVNGGYLVLNYGKYREKDSTAAARSRRYRERLKKRHTVTPLHNAVTTRNITQAEAEVQKKEIIKKEIPETLESVPGFVPEWNNFLLNRRAKGARATPRAQELILRKLAERPKDAVAGLQMAIIQNWTGFQWEWFDKQRAALPYATARKQKEPAPSYPAISEENSEITEEQRAAHRAKVRELSEALRKQFMSPDETKKSP